MKKTTAKKTNAKKKNATCVSYRIKCKRTANGLSHYVPAEKKSLV